jgi:hypothetical protein
MSAGRAYPLMTPTMRVDRQLTQQEAHDWLARAKPSEY